MQIFLSYWKVECLAAGYAQLDFNIKCVGLPPTLPTSLCFYISTSSVFPHPWPCFLAFEFLLIKSIFFFANQLVEK